MAKSKRQRNRKEKRRASAVDRAEKQRSGVKPYLDLPSGVKMFSFDKEGTKKLDIIEYRAGDGNPNAKKGDLYFERTFWTHRNIGPDNESHICLAKTYKKKCPACEYRAKLARRSDSDEDELDALKPTERQLFRVVDPKKKKNGIQVLDISNFFFGKELDNALRKQKKIPKTDRDKFASPDEGLTCRCEIEEGSYKKFPTFKCKMLKLVPREEQYEEDMSDEGPVLDELLKPLSYKQFAELFNQSVDDDDEDDEDLEEDSELDDEDDDDDDEDDSDEDDEDESEDDDEDDEDESDDDEDDVDEDDDADEDDEDDDFDDADDEEDDDEEMELVKGAKVSFTYKGKKRKGKVVRIKNSLAHIKCKDRSDAYAVDPDDCTVLGGKSKDDDEAFDEDNEKPRKGKKKRKKQRV